MEKAISCYNRLSSRAVLQHFTMMGVYHIYTLSVKQFSSKLEWKKVPFMVQMPFSQAFSDLNQILFIFVPHRIPVQISSSQPGEILPSKGPLTTSRYFYITTRRQYWPTSGERPGILLAILQGTRQAPRAKNFPVQLSVLPKLRNPRTDQVE